MIPRRRIDIRWRVIRWSDWLFLARNTAGTRDRLEQVWDKGRTTLATLSVRIVGLMRF